MTFGDEHHEKKRQLETEIGPETQGGLALKGKKLSLVFLYGFVLFFSGLQTQLHIVTGADNTLRPDQGELTFRSKEREN